MAEPLTENIERLTIKGHLSMAALDRVCAALLHDMKWKRLPELVQMNLKAHEIEDYQRQYGRNKRLDSPPYHILCRYQEEHNGISKSMLYEVLKELHVYESQVPFLEKLDNEGKLFLSQPHGNRCTAHHTAHHHKMQTASIPGYPSQPEENSEGICSSCSESVSDTSSMHSSSSSIRDNDECCCNQNDCNSTPTLHHSSPCSFVCNNFGRSRELSCQGGQHINNNKFNINTVHGDVNLHVDGQDVRELIGRMISPTSNETRGTSSCTLTTSLSDSTIHCPVEQEKIQMSVSPEKESCSVLIHYSQTQEDERLARKMFSFLRRNGHKPVKDKSTSSDYGERQIRQIQSHLFGQVDVIIVMCTRDYISEIMSPDALHPTRHIFKHMREEYKNNGKTNQRVVLYMQEEDAINGMQIPRVFYGYPTDDKAIQIHKLVLEERV